MITLDGKGESLTLPRQIVGPGLNDGAAALGVGGLRAVGLVLLAPPLVVVGGDRQKHDDDDAGRQTTEGLAATLGASAPLLSVELERLTPPESRPI